MAENIVRKGEIDFKQLPSYLIDFRIRIVRRSRACVDQSVATTGGHWFDPRLDQYSFRGLMTFIPNAAECFDNSYIGKQPVAWKEYCAE